VSMSAQDWLDLATVYRAGAGEHRGYGFNASAQLQADGLDAMAERCIDIAVERGAPVPEKSAFLRSRELRAEAAARGKPW
jgi:hypothetical protein